MTNAANWNYNTTHWECLGIVGAILLLRPYLNNHNFTIRTYQEALIWISNEQEGTGKMARSQLRLSEFEFEFCTRL